MKRGQKRERVLWGTQMSQILPGNNIANGDNKQNVSGD